MATVASEAEPANRLTFTSEYEPQRRFVTARERYVAFISGIGAGKTVGGIGRLLRNVYEWNAGHTGFVVAPTVPSLRTTIIPELEKWGILDRCEFNRTEKRLDFPNGSTVFLDSADNDRKIQRLRGPSIGWFWMDEAATIDKRAWDVLIGRLRDGDNLNAFVTTTPKGYNWVYDRFNDADDATVIKGVPSHANPHLPDEYAEITDEYDGSFYEQEVLGEFTDFEGLVHPWFDDENLVDEPPEDYDEVVYGVDWGHNNPGVVLAIVRSGETWTVVDETYERRMTVNDHSEEVAALVEAWGEGPIYADPSEPANIETFRRNGLPARPAENDVTPGIQHVSSLRGNLRAVRSCQNVRNEFNQYQYKDGGDDDRPLKQHDHCLVAGTLVHTDRGDVPIEQVTVGDRVLTRAGWQPVISAGKTNTNVEVMRVEFTNGTELTGTSEHPVFVESKGYTYMDALRYGDICRKIKSSTKASPSTATTGATTARVATPARTVSIGSTGRSGVTTTARYPKATSSTTRMATRQTMTLGTSNVSLPRNTPNSTPSGVVKSPALRSKPQGSGTNPKKAGSGTQNTGNEHSPRRSRQSRRSANSAASRSPTCPRTTGGSSAPTPVRQSTGERVASTTRSESVTGAGIPSPSTSTAIHEPVRVAAVHNSVGTADVYNCTVANQHEYFANGILVHNSMDALRYALFTYTPPLDVEPDDSGISYL